MTPSLGFALTLGVLGVLLVGPAPRVMARCTIFRRAPRAALWTWQCVTVAGTLTLLLLGPALLPTLLDRGADAGLRVVAGLGAVVSLIVLGRLIVSGHRVGTRLRDLRGRHLDLLEIIAEHGRDGVRVIAHPTPTAYCLPGAQSRVVLSQGALDALSADQLAAVLTHEQAHLKARHDLLLEFFSVAHTAVPAPARSEAALHEVTLLVEALADRASVRRTGALATARALNRLALGSAPEAALAAGAASAPVRIRLIAAGAPPRGLAALMGAYASTVVLLPLVLTSAAWLS